MDTISETYRVVGILPDGTRVQLLNQLTLLQAEEHRQNVAASSKLPGVEIELEGPDDYPVADAP